MNFSSLNEQGNCSESSTARQPVARLPIACLPIALGQSTQRMLSQRLKYTSRSVILLIACLGFLSVADAETPVQDELENGIYLQETVGDLAKAIDAYKKVVKFMNY